MGIQKISLANIQGKLSRTEMKNIMAGSSGISTCGNHCNLTCKVPCRGVDTNGTCTTSAAGKCYCGGGC